MGRFRFVLKTHYTGWIRLIRHIRQQRFPSNQVKFELTMYFKHEMLVIWQRIYRDILKKVWFKWNFELIMFELTVSDLYSMVKSITHCRYLRVLLPLRHVLMFWGWLKELKSIQADLRNWNQFNSVVDLLLGLKMLLSDFLAWKSCRMGKFLPKEKGRETSVDLFMLFRTVSAGFACRRQWGRISMVNSIYMPYMMPINWKVWNGWKSNKVGSCSEQGGQDINCLSYDKNY